MKFESSKAEGMGDVLVIPRYEVINQGRDIEPVPGRDNAWSMSLEVDEHLDEILEVFGREARLYGGELEDIARAQWRALERVWLESKFPKQQVFKLNSHQNLNGGWVVEGDNLS